MFNVRGKPWSLCQGPSAQSSWAGRKKRAVFGRGAAPALKDVEFVVLEICMLPTIPSGSSYWARKTQGLLFNLQISGQWSSEKGSKSVYSVYITEILRRISRFLSC